MSRRQWREIVGTMSNLLLWLAMPLCLAPFAARRQRLGGAGSQLILAGLGLGALQQGVGTLDPRDLRDVASQSPHTAWFIGITLGAMLTGACLFPDVRNWRKAFLGTPLLIGALLATPVHRALALLIGALIGMIPTALGPLLVWRSAMSVPPQDGAEMPLHEVPATTGRTTALLLAAGAVLGAVWGPALIAGVALVALDWRQWTRHPTNPRTLARLPFMPVLATILLAVWLWLALTIAGSPWASLAGLATDAPISMAASQLLALLAIGWGIAIASPWPFDRTTDVAVQLPPLAVVLYLAVHATPGGVAHWQPLLTLIAVPMAIVAAARGRWDGAVSALLLLAATRPGVTSLSTALLLAIVPLGRRRFGFGRLVTGVAGAAAAFAIVTVLHDQVVLAVLLALGLAVALTRYDQRVAPAGSTRHL
ncbi:MAG: hypothetical protein ACRELE_12260 [Gemmatimonadales bacterium]